MQVPLFILSFCGGPEVQTHARVHADRQSCTAQTLGARRCNATLSNEFAEFLATYDLKAKARQCGYMPSNPRHARIFVALECVASISSECHRESQDLAAFNNAVPTVAYGTNRGI